MTDQQLDDLTRQVEKLKPDEQLELMQRIIMLLRQEKSDHDSLSPETEETWTDEELAELFKPRQALTGKEIVEKHLATGVIGSWAHLGIQDGADWVNAQKAQRKKKHQW